MKGNPFTTGGVQGTQSHASALKKKEEDVNKLIEKRRRLEEKKKRKEEKGRNTKRLDKKLDKTQEKIDKNPTAQEWKNKKETNKQTKGEPTIQKTIPEVTVKPVEPVDLPEKVEIRKDNTRIKTPPPPNVKKLPKKKENFVDKVNKTNKMIIDFHKDVLFAPYNLYKKIKNRGGKKSR